MCHCKTSTSGHVGQVEDKYLSWPWGGFLKTAKTGAFVACLLLLGGCASGYKEFYEQAQNFTPERIAEMRVAPPTGVPILERAYAADTELLESYAKRGFVMIGSSMFNSGIPDSESDAIEQAKRVGADLVVILTPRYTGSVATSIPITTPTTTTSYSSGTATAYGAHGPVTAYGSGTTTTHGSTTTYMPMTVHRSDYGAMFFIKQRFGLGVFPRDLTDSERQKLQTNKGAAVHIIVDGTPAFNSDFLVGDIVTSIDGVPVSSAQSFLDMLLERRGQRVSFSILRQGQRIEKTVQLAK